MVKRRRTKLSLGNKTKSNDKEKAVESTNSGETSRKNDNILVSRGRVDGSPLFTKKLKLDSSLSPSANKLKRYIPPFSASVRVSNRLRNRMHGEKSEGNSSSQESKILVEGENVSKNIKQGKENLQEKHKKESSAMVLQAREGKADEMSTDISVRTQQSDVQMESMKEKDAGKDRREEVASKKVSEITRKQTGIEVHVVESLMTKPEDENTATQQEIGGQSGQENLQQVSKFSDLTQQSCDKIEINGRKEEKERMAKNMSYYKSESLKGSMENKVETSGVILGQMSDVTARSTIEAPMDDFDALGLHTLADTCAVIAAVENVVGVVEEPGKSNSSQINMQNQAETKGMHRAERRDHKNENKKSSNEIDGKKAQKDVMAIINESIDKSSSTSSQEIIKDKLSEILSMVTENELSQMKSKRGPNATTKTGNTDKDGKDDPCKANVTDAGILVNEREKCKRNALEERVMMDTENGSSVKSETRKGANGTVTEILTIESDKCKPDGLQERVSMPAKGNIEMMSVDDPAIIEKEEDAGNKEVSAHVNIDKNVQKATVEGTCNKGFSSQKASERIEDFISKAMIDDQKVPDRVAKSPEQEVPEKMVLSSPSRKEKDVSVILKKNNTETCNHNEVQSILTSNENSTTILSHNESKKVETTEEKVDIRTPNNTIDEESYTEEFRELEELLPRDDMGLFDDVIMSKAINVNDDLRCADSTVEFLINEINSLHCMVANYERAVEDMKRPQYKSRF